MGIGSNLKRRREAVGMTQKVLAETVGVSQPAIAQIESGVTRNPTLDVLMSLANVLGVKVDDLLRLDTEETPATDAESVPVQSA